MLDPIKFVIPDEQKLVKSLEDRLGINITFSGSDLEKAIKADFHTTCKSLIAIALARQIYSTIDEEFNALTPQFSVTLENIDYKYKINNIWSHLNELSYDSDKNEGHAFQLLTTDVTLSGGHTVINEHIYLTVRYMFKS
jgi:hypothetical protein